MIFLFVYSIFLICRCSPRKEVFLSIVGEFAKIAVNRMVTGFVRVLEEIGVFQKPPQTLVVSRFVHGSNLK